MKERGILFTGPMVRAILNSTKTQTRRIIKPQPEVMYDYPSQPELIEFLHPKTSGTYSRESFAKTCKYGVPGDRLWVRESFALVNPLAGCELNKRPEYDGVRFKSTWDKSHASGWKPSIHMPRWASRITLEITGVRVERLHDISEQDAEDEGVDMQSRPALINGEPGTYHPIQASYEYARLWNKINGEGSWVANPWVWVVEFKRLEGGHS